MSPVVGWTASASALCARSGYLRRMASAACVARASFPPSCAGAGGDVLPVNGLRALDAPSAARAPRAVEGVDEGAVPRVVVRPEEAGAAARGDEPAALLN